MKNSLYLFFVLTFFTAHILQSSTLPVDKPKLTSTFGESRNDHFHNGIDFGGGEQKVKSFLDGQIIFYSDKGEFPFQQYMGSGNYIIIQHQKNLKSYYLHLKDNSINKTNSFVKEGQYIGLTSNTGHSYGTHLHFSIENTQLQEMLNPLLYFRDNLQNKLNPKIEGILMQMDKGKIKPIPNILKLQDKAKMTLLVKCYAFMHDSKNNMCPYKITCFINKEKYIEYTFDKLMIKKNNYFLPLNYSFNDIYADKDTFILGIINLQKQDYSIEIIVEDIFGNQSKAKKIFRVL